MQYVAPDLFDELPAATACGLCRVQESRKEMIRAIANVLNPTIESEFHTVQAFFDTIGLSQDERAAVAAAGVTSLLDVQITTELELKEIGLRDRASRKWIAATSKYRP